VKERGFKGTGIYKAKTGFYRRAGEGRESSMPTTTHAMGVGLAANRVKGVDSYYRTKLAVNKTQITAKTYIPKKGY